jgi:hypothetical protein
MRQLAVFDKKYYHSIQKKSQSTVVLKKQNFFTVLFHFGLVLVTFGIILVFPYSSVFSLFGKISEGFWRIVYWVIELISKIDTGDIGNDLQEDPVSMEMVVEESPVSALVLTIIAFVGMALIMILLAITGVKVLKKVIKDADANNAGADDSVIDTIENIGPLKKMFSKKDYDFGSGHERVIRKQFYDKTRNAMKKGLPVGDTSTPGQIEAVLSAYGDEDISSLREEYENVRYGQNK